MIPLGRCCRSLTILGYAHTHGWTRWVCAVGWGRTLLPQLGILPMSAHPELSPD